MSINNTMMSSLSSMVAMSDYDSSRRMSVLKLVFPFLEIVAKTIHNWLAKSSPPAHPNGSGEDQLFLYPSSTDNLSIVQHSFQNGTTKVSQDLLYCFIMCIMFILTIIILTTCFVFDADCSYTHYVLSILPEQVTGFIFIFSYVDVMHHGVEVSGMDFVQVIHGWEPMLSPCLSCHLPQNAWI